ncbi:MAG: hypothetical protein ACE5E9_13170 [Nitrospinaceae bacterium]
MHTMVCWGILREPDHSPNRIEDDAAILQETGAKIRKLAGSRVTLFRPDEVPSDPSLPPPDLVFFMCEEPGILQTLETLEKNGVCMVNTPESVRNTFRYKTYQLLKEQDYFPDSTVVSTHVMSSAPFRPSWVKRLDFHAMNKDDVCFVPDKEQLQSLLARLRKRGVEGVLLQEHMEGDLIKFYGVGDRWFHWFYHKDQDLQGCPVDDSRLKAIARQSARRLGPDIYGGDVIVTPEGKIYLIDLNAWPSFALFRDVASNHIASFIVEKIKNLSLLKI